LPTKCFLKKDGGIYELFRDKTTRKEIVAVAAFGWNHLPGDNEYGVLILIFYFSYGS